MRKTEIKARLQEIKETIQRFRDELHEILEPYYVIASRLDDLYDDQENAGIILEIDYEDVKMTAFRDVISENELWENIEADFDNFLEELEAWTDEVSENKAEQIRECYIDVIESMKCDVDIYEVEDEDSLDDMLIGIQNQIDEFEYL